MARRLIAVCAGALLISAPAFSDTYVRVRTLSCPLAQYLYSGDGAQQTVFWDITAQNLQIIMHENNIGHLQSYDVEQYAIDALRICDRHEVAMLYEALRKSVMGDQWSPTPGGDRPLPAPRPSPPPVPQPTPFVPHIRDRPIGVEHSPAAPTWITSDGHHRTP